MFHKRRLTGYLEDTKELIQSRRDEWEERATRYGSLRRDRLTFTDAGTVTQPARPGGSKRRGTQSEKSSPRSESPGRQKRLLGIGPRMPSAVTIDKDDGTDVDVLPPGVKKPTTPQMEKQKRLTAALKEQCKMMQMTEKQRKSRSDNISVGKHKERENVSNTRKKDRKKTKEVEEKSDAAASGDNREPSSVYSAASLQGSAPSMVSDVREMKKSKAGNASSKTEYIGIYPTDGFSSLQASMDIVCPGDPKPTSSFKAITPPERKLLELSRSGSVPLVQRYLTSRPKVNINIRNYNGETPLRIAVKMGHEGLVAFLSSLKNIEQGDILFHAIFHKQIAVVKLLCETHDLDHKVDQIMYSEFPKYITPLSLAGEVGMYETIDYFINVRGHELIQKPHHVRCRCLLICQPWKRGDPIEVAYQTLHIYSALSRPSYFVHATDNPLMWAFELHHTLVEVADFHVALKSCFLRLAKRVQNFAVKFIAECRNSGEVRALLSHSTAPMGFWDNLSESQLPTLMMALEGNQKCFVAHPNVQVVVKDIWQGDYYKWRTMSSLTKAIVPFVRLAFVPYIYYLLLFQPAAKATRRFALPLNKMLLSLSSYILFLGFIFYANIKPRTKVRAPYTYKDVEFYIVIFVLAYTCNTIRQALLMHPRRFFKYGWNLYDVCTLTAFWLAIAFWISAQIHFNMIPSHLQVLERKYWGSLDPVLMADGFFVIGSVLAYLRLLFYFQISKHIGPMQVAMDSMVKEFVKYSIFWLLILLSFTVALGKFYSYYSGMKYVDPETGNTMKQENGFVDFKSTFNTLFWGIFGLSSYTNADVVIENIETRNGTYLNKHDFTEFVGYFAFGSYTIMMGIIIINMIIATMSAAFARVLVDGEAEWSVQETHVYTYYMCHAVLPPPFNLLPHGPVGSAKPKAPKTKSRYPAWCPPPPPPPPPHTPPPSTPPVSDLVRKIVLRYFHTKAEKKRKKPVCFYPR